VCRRRGGVAVRGVAVAVEDGVAPAGVLLDGGGGLGRGGLLGRHLVGDVLVVVLRKETHIVSRDVDEKSSIEDSLAASRVSGCV
jgi:hypothetical protein